MFSYLAVSLTNLIEHKLIYEYNALLSIFALFSVIKTFRV